MKIRLILAILANILIPFLSYGYPVYMSVHHNPANNHAVFLWGDAHPAKRDNTNEVWFMNFVSPYFKILLNGQLNCIIGVETNNEFIANIFRELEKKIIKPHEMQFLRRCSLIATNHPIPFLKEWLGIDKSIIPFFAIDNRVEALFKFIQFSRSSIPFSAKKTVNELLNNLNQIKMKVDIQTQQIIQQYIDVIKSLNYLKAIDKLFFEEDFANGLNNYINIVGLRNSFINGVILSSNSFSPNNYSINDLNKQIKQWNDYCCRRNISYSDLDAEKNIWADICGQLKWLEEAISIFGNSDLPLEQCIINKALEVKSFSAFSRDYELTDQDNEDIENIQNIVIHFTRDYPNANFFDNALISAMNHKHFVCIAGAKHCRTVAEWLEKIGYNRIVKYDVADNQGTIEIPTEVKMLIGQRPQTSAVFKSEMLSQAQIHSAFEAFYQLAK